MSRTERNPLSQDDATTFPVAEVFPALSLGIASWKSCGSHVFIGAAWLESCPVGTVACGMPLRDATDSEVVAAEAVAAKWRLGPGEDEGPPPRKCRRCGLEKPMPRRGLVCDDCVGSADVDAQKNGGTSQRSWDGRRHTCCGAARPWHHRAGCPGADGTLPPDK